MIKNFFCFIKDTFYGPTEMYKPCGMFTPTHIIAVIICAILIVCVLIAAKKSNSDFICENRQILNAAIFLTVMELIKITHAFIHSNFNLDSWVPLSFCSLFMYALWIYRFGKGRLRKCAEVFIAYGCPVGGIAFLIFPTTSLMGYPIYHFLSLHSLIYHTMMIIFGILMLKRQTYLKKSDMLLYSMFLLVFSAVSIMLNVCYGSNFMDFANLIIFLLIFYILFIKMCHGHIQY